MASDADEFGAIVDSLVGCACERTLAANSIKLRFETDLDPRGRKYIWIDPPWRLVSAAGLLTSSADYDDDHFHEWSNLLAPLDNRRFAVQHHSKEQECGSHS